MDILLRYFADFSEKQIEQFRQLEPLYREWNEKINVVSRKDIDSLYTRHVLHSLSIAATVNFQPGMQIIDLGTGGGFPGVPLAIFFPETKFHLVDSIAKKLKVVDEIAVAVGLNNITTQHTRVEAIRDRKFNFVVSRAVAPLKDLWSWSRPLLKKQHEPLPEGNTEEIPVPGLICLKGGDLNQEIQESHTRPRIMPIADLFPEDFFEEKFVVYVPRS
ncbi:MAG: 16S rRNA (guanine(527)-N(7))-methyltransferase RsmG [Chitinophagaceae bacterium]|nr:16S rRNA (guanine(527)-N(7))-methyltransferase RsmG [Chitinophagaceae bacterium]